MDRVILAAPLLPERAEAWRRFCQEMMGRRRQQYERSRRRLKIQREAAWLVSAPHGAVAVIAIDAPDPTATLEKMATSRQPFDRWFRRTVFEIHGLDLSRPLGERADERVFQWHCPEQ